MKAFRRTILIFAVTAALLPLFRAPTARAMTLAANGKIGALCSNQFVKGMSRDERMEAAEKNDGLNPVTPREYVISRLGTFANTFDCNIFLCLWMDMEDAAFDGTFDELVEDLAASSSDAKFTAEDTVVVVYVQDLDQSYIRVGKDVAANCDLSAVEAALRDPSETDNYFKATKVIDALAQALRDAGAEGKYLLKCEPSSYEEQIARALAPLREQFPGYIRVFYVEHSETRDGMAAELAQLYDEFLRYPMEDAIYIGYYRNNGEAVVRAGEQTGLTVKNLAAVEAAFQPGADGEDFSGFSAGVSALSEALGPRGGISPVLIGGAAAMVLLLVLATVALARRKRR